MLKKTNDHTYKSVEGRDIAIQKSYVAYDDFQGSRKLGVFVEDSFAIVLFEKAKGNCTINSTEYAVKPRQLLIQFPEKKEKWKLQAGSKGRRLLIREVLAETFSTRLQFTFSPYNPHPVVDLDVETYRKLDAEFLAVKKEMAAKTVFVELVHARCRLIGLIINLWVEHKLGETIPSASGSIAYKFHSLVERHYKTQKTVSFYAKHLCVTSNYLGSICRKQYKMTALAFIQERILLEAKRLLHSSDRSIKEIAFDLGFRNLSYFSYFFKSKTGLTPKEYKLMLEKS